MSYQFNELPPTMGEKGPVTMLSPKEFDPFPALPTQSSTGIGLIGCGGITEHHLIAYRKAGWNVVALCDLDESRAIQRRNEFYPNARVFSDYRQLLRLEEVQVVDVATHPPERPAIIQESLRAGKHVLSQKPFVTDLREGERLCDLADHLQLKLAVNQNGRFAPHFFYMRQAIRKGFLGAPFCSHLSVHWDHSWVRGTPFEEVKHLILFDFAIHWFDILRCFMPNRQVSRVFASTARPNGQLLKPNMLGQALIEWPDGQSTIAFDSIVRFGPFDQSYVSGSEGSLRSFGTDYHQQTVILSTSHGDHIPTLRGRWFSDAFWGTMGELLLSIEENRPCEIAARDNLESLAICFAAVASADSGRPVSPWEVTQLPN